MPTIYGYVPAKDYDIFEKAYANHVIYCSTENNADNNNFIASKALRYGSIFAEISLLNTTLLELES